MSSTITKVKAKAPLTRRPYESNQKIKKPRDQRIIRLGQDAYPWHREYMDRSGALGGCAANDWEVYDSFVASCLYCRKQPEDHFGLQCPFAPSTYKAYGRNRTKAFIEAGEAHLKITTADP